MKRIEKVSNILTAKKPELGNKLRQEIERMKIQPKKLQVMEDQRRIMREWLDKADIDGPQFRSTILGPFEQYRAICAELAKDKDFRSYSPNTCDDRDEARNHTNLLLKKILQRFKFSTENYDDQFWLQLGAFDGVGMVNSALATKVAVHTFLYAKTIFVLGSERHKILAQRAFEGRDLGCFALTEITHGSNVQGCITTAKFDEQLDSFIINTPHERGIKFWIGNAAQTANMSVVLANLIVKGKDYGIHCFVVQIRDDEHEVMPGVQIIDCGAKMGIHGVDNGILNFRNVIIPRENLLDKVTQVDKDGNVESLFAKKEKRFAVQLSSLSDGRIKAGLTGLTTGMLELTVAARFTAMHRQYGSDEDKYKEQIMLNYPLIQNNIIPYYAKCLVPYFMGVHVGDLWSKNYKRVFDPKDQSVKEMHALISIYKPVCSWYQLKTGISAMHSCENFGFMQANGICGRIEDAHVNATWEGDNTVLLIQTTQFILSNLGKHAKGETIAYKSLSYLQKWIPEIQESVKFTKPQSADAFENLDLLGELLEYRAAKAAIEGGMEIQLGLASNSAFDAFNNSLPFANNKAALFYGELFMFNQCKLGILTCENPKNARFLKKVLTIYALTLVKETSEFYLDYLNTEVISVIEDTLLKLFEEVKYNMIASLNFLYQDDHVIKSAIGSSDGNIYDRVISKLNSDRRNMGKSDDWRYLLEVRRHGINADNGVSKSSKNDAEDEFFRNC